MRLNKEGSAREANFIDSLSHLNAYILTIVSVSTLRDEITVTNYIFMISIKGHKLQSRRILKHEV